jgi:hypothetical protein
MEAVKDVSERMKTVNLHEAEMAMKGNAGEALDNIERNLFVMRARILSEQVCQDFCVNGQVLFLGWGAGEGCPFPCPSM